MMVEELRQAWQEPLHADLFDARARFSLEKLKRSYEKFNEFQLFLENKDVLNKRVFVEIACATGELYRYLSTYHPEFSYFGFDISKPAIERAQKKYPDAQFALCQPDLSDIIARNLRAGVLWARDVLHHQPVPYAFLSNVLEIEAETMILRTRTRDQGETVLDPELSCQWHYNHWVPYIVFNLDELVERICTLIPVQRIQVLKRYEPLGGRHDRFLPKECYYPETGTAETALCIVRGQRAGQPVEISISTRKETVVEAATVSSPLWRRILRQLCNTLWLPSGD